jgi:3-hydroxybutyryl-CoA dehydrogenase
MSAGGPAQGANSAPAGASAAAKPQAAAPIARDAIVAVIGAGAMGSGIAQIAAQAGHRVLLHDARADAAANAQRSVATTLAALAAKGKLSTEAAQAAAARIVPVARIAELREAALVVEAIVEDLAAKRALFTELEGVVPDSTILATNTSSLSVTALAAGLRVPRRVVGMHFFNPAPILPLVEVVSGLGTSRDVAGAIHATALEWGKTPVHASSTPGFIVNRCARPFYAEGLRLLAERAADCATIDAVMREAGGFRMGPFELMDLIGHDVNFAVTRSVWEAYFNDPRFLPSVLQRELVDAGWLGRKSGRGFYDHTPGAQVPPASSEARRDPPRRVSIHGDLGPARALVARWRAAGVSIDEHDTLQAFPDGVIATAGAWLALTDGRTATSRALASGAHRLVLFDLALDYAQCKRLAVACADSCDADAASAAIGALQAAGVAVSRLDDVAGLAVMRTVAMLANEAADAVTQGVATPPDLDLAMQKGVNYPRGPLAWGDTLGAARVREVLQHLAAHYGEDRYRTSPLIARRAAIGGKLVLNP